MFFGVFRRTGLSVPIHPPPPVFVPTPPPAPIPLTPDAVDRWLAQHPDHIYNVFVATPDAVDRWLQEHPAPPPVVEALTPDAVDRYLKANPDFLYQTFTNTPDEVARWLAEHPPAVGITPPTPVSTTQRPVWVGPQSAWWNGTVPITQAYGCTDFEQEGFNPYHPECKDHIPYFHEGIDFGLPAGTPIYAGRSCRVLEIDPPGYGPIGNSAAIRLQDLDGEDHMDIWMYHAQSYQVKVGDVIPRYAQILQVGSRGYATGPHLHFEVRPHGAPYRRSIDPTPWLQEATAPSNVGGSAFMNVAFLSIVLGPGESDFLGGPTQDTFFNITCLDSGKTAGVTAYSYTVDGTPLSAKSYLVTGNQPGVKGPNQAYDVASNLKVTGSCTLGFVNSGPGRVRIVLH